MDFLTRRFRAFRNRRRSLAFHAAFIRPGDLVFDVGAHDGERTALYRRLDARVVAVEPQSTCLARLRRDFDADPHVALEAAAVGSEPGRTDLLLCDEWTACATLSGEFVSVFGNSQNLHWSRRETVDVTTLDALVARHGPPAFCKIDVEGNETAVLLGLTTPLPSLSFEVNRPMLGMATRCVSRLLELGRYEFNLIHFERMRFVLPVWEEGEVFLARLEERHMPSEVATGEVFARLVGEPMPRTAQVSPALRD